MTGQMDRRNFMKLGGLAAAATVAAVAAPRFSWAATQTVGLQECLEMTPQAMASGSQMVTGSMAYIRREVATISNPSVQKKVTEILNDPTPTIMQDLADSTHRDTVRDQLRSAGLLDAEGTDFLPPLPPIDGFQPTFLSAPGSGYSSHHAYPGGLVTHTALNLRASLAIYDSYRTTFGFDLDRDTVIASQVLHDLHKPWVFQWGPDGQSRAERKLAATGEHHPLGVAESIKRGLPAEICIAQACAHDHPGFEENEASVVGWLKAAAIIAGADPVKAGLLDKTGTKLPRPIRMEGFVCHLGDHDWVLSVPAAKWLVPHLKDIAMTRYGIKAEDTARFNSLRNYVFAQTSIMNLYAVYSSEGKSALEDKVRAIVSA